jgi:hypothetical protein
MWWFFFQQIPIIKKIKELVMKLEELNNLSNDISNYIARIKVIDGIITDIKSSLEFGSNRISIDLIYTQKSNNEKKVRTHQYNGYSNVDIIADKKNQIVTKVAQFTIDMLCEERADLLNIIIVIQKKIAIY